MWGGASRAASELLWPEGNFRMPPEYGGERTAFTNEAWNTYMDRARNMQGPDFNPYIGRYNDLGNQMQSGLRDPNAVQFNSQYAPGQFNVNQFQMNDPFAGYNGGGPGMQVQAPGGIGTKASDYQVGVDQVRAPDAVQYERISGLPQVSGPQLQNYQMTGPERVQAPGNIQSFNIDPSQLGRVSTGTVGTGSWTAPGTQQQFMDPYQQGVVNEQKKRAQRDYDKQLTNIHSDAAKSGAFGGSRQAVIEAEANRDLQDRMSGIEAQGLQQAYQSGMGQFNTEQGLGLGAQQFNQQIGLQGQQLNQQQMQQVALANQQAQLQAQGLGTNTNLQAMLANQQAGLTAGGQNLQALLQTQGLGAQLGMQGQLANQQMAWNSANANQQAGLQAGMFNNQQAMQAQQLNQASNLQAGLAAQQMGLQGATTAGGWGLQAQGMNQQAQQNQFNRQMQGLQTQYGGNLASGLQTQNLGMDAQKMAEQSRQFGTQFGLSAQQAQEQAQNARAGMNLNYYTGMGNMNQQGAGLAQQGFQNDMSRNTALGQASQTQMAYDQAKADRDFNYWQQQQQYPFQMLDWYTQLMQRGPQAGGLATTQNGTQVVNTPNPSPWNIIGGAVASGAGAAAKAYGA